MKTRLTGFPGALMDALKALAGKDPASIFAIEVVAVERLRQIEGEGWTPLHDDRQAPGDLSLAAAAYASAPHRAPSVPPSYWPWSAEWWKPGSKDRNNTKAGALILAEIARHFRSAPDTGSDHA